MTIFAQSIQRLYLAGKLTLEQVTEQLNKGRLAQDEYSEITK